MYLRLKGQVSYCIYNNCFFLNFYIYISIIFIVENWAFSSAGYSDTSLIIMTDAVHYVFSVLSF